MTDETAPATQHPLRWAVIGLIFCATLVSYIDRQTVSVMAPVLCKDLSMTNTQYGAVGSCFLFAYALSMWLWGGVFDKVGSRLGYTLAISIWSVAEIAHAAVTGILSLGFLRGLLGIGEAGNWPGATRTIAAWFSNKERALGMGIANAGASFGPALAAPLIIGLQLTVGWRATFVLTGLLGILWLWAWISIYPKSMELESARPLTSNLNEKWNPSTLIPWPILIRRKEVWAIILARFFGDPIWWLYLNWLPKYLSDVRHFSMKQIGASAWAPFLAAGAGALLGGWLSGQLISWGWSVNRSRKTAILFATLLLPAGVGAAYVDSPITALACIGVTLFAFQFWVSNVQTLASDLLPVGAVGSIAGFAGTAAGLGAMIFTFTTGWVVDRFSYTPILLAAGLLAPIATGVLFLLIGSVRRLDIAPEQIT
ncbi:MAG: MFS transporter [Verrucomicrobia bacterium]|nr:MAG: MFS transporter [Verrucomicrobiota bacterium]